MNLSRYTGHNAMLTLEQYLRESAVQKKIIDDFLDPNTPTWARFDEEVGYTLGNYLPRDGIDDCSTLSTSQERGTRTAHMYTDRPCRINTYGNSFTECHQVSDGETWQEYLAAHFGEPIRNFGMGGFGVYQAWRRMRRAEKSADAAKYLILYVWGDDHMRSLMRCRHATFYGRLAMSDEMFHSNFWCHMEMDLDAGRLVEKENPLATPESLYKMTDPDFMLDALKDDLILQLCVTGLVTSESLDIPRLNALAEILGVPPIDNSSREDFLSSSERIKLAYGFAATQAILELTAEFCRENEKELLIALLCPRATRQLLNGCDPYDHVISEYLEDHGFRYFDMNRVHLDDYRSFNLSIEDYMKRYFIGHYSPTGNHFFAFAIKDTLVEMLDPKPITYRSDQEKVIEFGGYLPETR